MALLGQGFEDPRSAAIMALAGGLLKGDFGGGLLGANQEYGKAVDRQTLAQDRVFKQKQLEQELAEANAKRGFLSGLPSPENASPTQQMMLQGVRAGAMPFGDYLKAIQPKELPFAKVDPKDYTPESVQAFAQAGGDYTKLQPVRKLDVVNNQAVDLYKANPGTVFDMQDPNKPFMLRGGQPVANTPFQQYELGKAREGAAKTNISVNTEKSLLNEVAGGLGKSVTEARANAQGALGTINTVDRLFGALDSGKVMAGPGTTFRQFGLQVGNILGVTGKDAQEKMLNTRQAIQSLAQLELDAAQQMKGQGQITEAERSIIRRAASGDIDGMTTGELRLLGGVLDKSARFKIQGYNNQVKPLLNNPNAAPIAPFLQVQEPGQRTQPNILRFDAQGNPIP